MRGLAQEVERALRMREVAGSVPASSKLFSLLLPKISLNFPANFYKNINFKIA